MIIQFILFLVLVRGDDGHLREALSTNNITAIENLVNHFLIIPGNKGFDEPIIVSACLALANAL